ncbi:MAG: hypothetical protein Q9170_002586 [Blastenia crenularia]
MYSIPVTEDESRLRQYIALQKDASVVLAPRRHPPVPARAANTSTSISIQTSLGFGTLESETYVEAAQQLRPDIVLGLTDHEYMKRPGVKRLEKMGDRTLAWTQDMVARLRDDDVGFLGTALFAPVLPIGAEQQSYYLNTLKEELAADVSGWVVHDSASMDAIPAEMRHLPRLALTKLRGPNDVLDQISLGLDLFVPYFVGEATDAGIALTFTFPSPTRPQGEPHLALGVNMWSDIFVSDSSPIVENCQCYTCRNHYRAYIRHLLDAKEMLAWVLLQVHNYYIMDIFFDGVRQSMFKGTFDEDRELFERSYERQFPASTGPGPRIRGYQVKSGPAQPRRNPQAFRSLGDAREKLEDPVLPSPDASGEEREQQGFAEKLE